jgi:K+-sensing histidine kinase KdpD
MRIVRHCFKAPARARGIARKNWSIFLILSSRRRKQGMEIGLSIARTVVQAHKRMHLGENQSEGGALFRLSMPLTSQAEL